MSETISLPPDGRLFLFGRKFVRLNAMAIADWLENGVPADQRINAANTLGWRWLRLLVPAMGEPHALSESPNFYLLTVPKADEVRRLLKFLEEIRERLFRSLAASAPPRTRPKHLVVICGNRVDYDAMTAHQFAEREREMADSAGLFLNRGLAHIVLSSASLTDAHAILVHELVHDCLAHLSLPLWLNEGVTQLLEYELVSWAPFVLDREIMAKHKAYWTSETIKDFWTGRSFMAPGDDAQKLSYNLAVVLTRKLIAEVAGGKKSFWDFVCAADPDDAGDAALRAQFDLSLEDLMADFIGPGEWSPASVRGAAPTRIAF